MEAYKTVTEIVAQHLGSYTSDFTLETDLEQSGIDSYEMIEIIMELEDICNTDLFPDKLPLTVGDLVNLIHQN